jgi:hypothetical protein
MEFDTFEYQPDWQALANSCAEEAHIHHMSSHYGVFCIQDDDDADDKGILVIYDNHPYAKNVLLRERELDETRSRLHAEGFAELAFATFPKSGDGDGYTYAMVINASAEWHDFIGDLVEEARKAAREKHCA